MRIGICDDIREEVEKQEKQVRQITYQIGIRADIRKCYSGMDLLMEIELSGEELVADYKKTAAVLMRCLLTLKWMG